jgi:hypothetical protein
LVIDLPGLALILKGVQKPEDPGKYESAEVDIGFLLMSLGALGG